MKSIDIGVFVGAFLEWPWLALVPGVLFARAWLRHRRAPLLVAAVAWLVYFPYETAMKLRLLCTGECNIRVDLLALYPILIGLTVWAIVSLVRARRAPPGS